jgi:hypothetical protein
LAATPVDLFPRSAAAGDTMAGYVSTEQYLWGLRRILDGITARTEPTLATPTVRGQVRKTSPPG